MSIDSKVSSLNVEFVRGDRSLINQHAPEWEDLVQECLDSDPFSTPTWIGAWLQAFAPDAPVVLVVARRDGALRGILPLIEQRIGFQGRLLTRLTSPTNVHSGRIDLAHGEGDRSDVAKAIWNSVNRTIRWDILEYRDLAERSAFSEFAAAAEQSGCGVIVRKTIRSPYLGFDPGTDLSRSGPAKQLRRSRRILDRDGGYQLRRTAPADLAALQRLVDMEDAGWKGAAGTAIARDSEVLAFYRAVVSANPGLFSTVINEIVHNDQPIAINLGIEMGTRYYDPKRTYDEAHHRTGPGHLITHEILLDLPGRGISEFDIMGDDESYKMEWTKTVRQHYHYLIFRRGLKGSLLRKGVETLIPLVKTIRTRGATSGRSAAGSASPASSETQS